MIAPATAAIDIQPVSKSRCANSSAATPVAASSPYSDPPAKQIASTQSSSPNVPGEPPRTSRSTVAPPAKWKTVQPVGPSSYSATPIRRPGKSSSSSRIREPSVRHGNFRGQLRIRRDELPVRAQRRAAAALVQLRQDERRHLLPADSARVRVAQRVLDQRLDIEALVGWTGDEQPAARELPMRLRDARGLLRGFHSRGGRRSAVRRVEERQLVAPVREHGDAERLQHL